ncbi:MAG: Fur family transcriptional regulator [Acidimicrobiales bacterium]
MVDRLDETVGGRLRRVGQRYTNGRRTLIGVLAGTDRPLALPDILGISPSLTQSSVYRNLAVLEQAGVVHRVSTAGEFSRYELAEDLTEHHHHLVCVGCGSVADVVVPRRVEEAVQKAAIELAGDAGFTLEGHRLDLVGRCADCSPVSG